MGLVNYTQIQDGTSADANSLNERFGKIVDVVNGNIESINIKNSAITREKLGNGQVTSEKLGFTQYVDDNGWLITDLGLVKLGTKRRQWTFPKNSTVSAVVQTNFTGEKALNPVDFSAMGNFNVMWNISGNQSRFLNFQVDAERPEPGHDVSAKVVQPMNADANLYIHTWVVF